MQRLLFLFISFIFFGLGDCALHAQANAKDIYQLFGLKSGGCAYSNFKMAPMQESAVEAPPPPPPPVPLPDAGTPLETVNQFFAPLRAELANAGAYQPAPISLSKEVEGFFQKGKWGVRNKNGKVLLTPRFDYLIKHKNTKGFAAYKGVKCKFYDEETAKVLVNKEYYSIKPIAEGVYTVQGKNGLGLFKDGKEITEPRYKHIMREGNSEMTYYNLGNTLLLLDDYKSKFPYSWNGVKFIGKHIVVAGRNVYDTKNKRKLICEKKGYDFNALSKDIPLISVQKQGEKFFYLIDAKGRLISDKKFAELGRFSENGAGIAAIYQGERTHWSSKRFGLIDKKGNWLVEPTFKKIGYLNEQLHAWVDGRPKPFMIDENGKEITPQQANENYPEDFDEVLKITERHALGIYNKKAKEIYSKVFDVKTGEIIKDSLQYSQINLIRNKVFCDQGASIAHTKEGEFVVDSNYNVLLPVQQRYFYKGQYMEGFRRISMGKVVRSWYDCDGNTVKVKMNGEEIDTFHDLKIINDSLKYIYFSGDEGYILFEDGRTAPMPYHLQFINSAGHANLLWVMPYGNRGAGLINQAGEIVVPIQLKTINHFNHYTKRAAFETYDKKAGLLDEKGNLVNNQLYQAIRYLGFNLYKVESNKKIGVINQNGDFILPMQYKSVFLQEGLIFATKDGNKSAFDIKGKKLK